MEQNVRVNYNFDNALSSIKKETHEALLEYALEVRKFARERVPKDRETLLESTQIRRVDEFEYTVESNQPYAEEQHDEERYHLGRPGRSISKLYAGTKQKVINWYARKGNKNEYRKKIDNPKYNYWFGLRVLKGWQPVNEPYKTLAVKKGTLIKYKAEWFDEKAIEKRLGTLNDSMEKKIMKRILPL